MKLNTEIAGTKAPTESIHQSSLLAEAERKPQVESMESSPEQITKQASTTTQILTKILEQEEKSYYVHHWGINE